SGQDLPRCRGRGVRNECRAAVKRHAISLAVMMMFSTSCALIVSTVGLTGGVRDDGDGGGGDGGDGAGGGGVDGPAGSSGEAGSGSSSGGDVGAYAATVLADTPMAYWRFEETSGTVAHDEMKVHDATYVAANLGAPGIAGSR